MPVTGPEATLVAVGASLDPGDFEVACEDARRRRLLVARGFTDFVREFPLDWRGRTYRFDFAFTHRRTILDGNRYRAFSVRDQSGRMRPMS